MVEITKNISVYGFETKEEFDKWLKEQEKIQTDRKVLKMFKYFLMKIEKADKNKSPNFEDCELLDKYANEVVKRKIMNIDNVCKYITQARENKS